MNREKLLNLVERAVPIVRHDALMMGAITRFAPLDPRSQAKRDSTECESEKWLREYEELSTAPPGKPSLTVVSALGRVSVELSDGTDAICLSITPEGVRQLINELTESLEAAGG